MFDLVPKILASAASFLFPIFASYKALKTSDPAQLTPWLMYWVVFSLALLVESWFEWILVWVPFYSYIRLFFLLYLVLPQTQGARQIYLTYVHPWLEQNESEIEEFIGSLHERMRTAGLAYAKQAVEYLKSSIGLPASDDQQQQQAAAAGNDGGQSYTQSLLARFYLPAARWPGSVGTAPAHPTPVPTTASTDFYGMLQAAVSAATTAAISGTSGGSKSADAKDLPAKPAPPLIPDSIRGPTAKMSFITAQREKLNILMSALDREATQLQTEEAMHRDIRAPSIALDGASTEDEQQSSSAPTRPLSDQSVFSAISGLSKSRSEQDFVNLEAESGAEDDMDDAASMRRRTPGTPGVAGWMPWNWSAGGGSADQTGKSTGVEK